MTPESATLWLRTLAQDPTSATSFREWIALMLATARKDAVDALANHAIDRAVFEAAKVKAYEHIAGLFRDAADHASRRSA